MRGQHHRRVPVVTQRRLLDLFAWAYRCSAIGVLAIVETELIAGVDGIVARVDRDMHTIATADAAPVFAERPARARRTLERAVVLQAAVDVVRLSHIHIDRVELTDRLSIELQPAGAAVIADIHSAVVAIEHTAWIFTINPPSMVVDMHVRVIHAGEGLAAIGRGDQRHAQHIEAIGVVGRHAQLAKVVAVGEGHFTQWALVRALPVGAGIVGSVDFQTTDVGVEQRRLGIVERIDQVLDVQLITLDQRDQRLCIQLGVQIAAADEGFDLFRILGQKLRLAHRLQSPCRQRPITQILFVDRQVFPVIDTGIEHTGLARRQRQSDTTHLLALWQAAAEARPALAAIDRLVDARAGTGFAEFPGAASVIPHRRVQYLGVARVHRQIDRAGVARADQ